MLWTVVCETLNHSQHLAAIRVAVTAAALQSLLPLVPQAAPEGGSSAAPADGGGQQAHVATVAGTPAQRLAAAARRTLLQDPGKVAEAGGRDSGGGGSVPHTMSLSSAERDLLCMLRASADPADTIDRFLTFLTVPAATGLAAGARTAGTQGAAVPLPASETAGLAWVPEAERRLEKLRQQLQESAALLVILENQNSRKGEWRPASRSVNEAAAIALK